MNHHTAGEEDLSLRESKREQDSETEREREKRDRERTSLLNAEVVRKAERRCLLPVIEKKWRTLLAACEERETERVTERV